MMIGLGKGRGLNPCVPQDAHVQMLWMPISTRVAEAASGEEGEQHCRRYYTDTMPHFEIPFAGSMIFELIRNKKASFLNCNDCCCGLADRAWDCSWRRLYAGRSPTNA